MIDILTHNKTQQQSYCGAGGNDTVLYYDDGALKKTKLLTLRITDKEVIMFNVEYVRKNNTFFANKVLVHNKYVPIDQKFLNQLKKN